MNKCHDSMNPLQILIILKTYILYSIDLLFTNELIIQN